jgi:hypothetical protein
MKQGTQTTMQEAPLFAVDDHVRVQQQIEERAYELWRAGGCRGQAALSDWPQAEREVLEQFVLAYALRPSARPEPNRKPAAEVKAAGQETPSPRLRPTTDPREPAPPIRMS